MTPGGPFIDVSQAPLICQSANGGSIDPNPYPDPATGQLVSGTIEQETQRVLDNLRAVLQADGLDFADVVKTTVYLTDLGDFAGMNEIYAAHVGDSPPARATIEVSALPSGAKVEIEAIALAD